MKFAQPWYRPSRGVWYVTLDGRQINLGAEKQAAFDRYKELLSQPNMREIHSDSLAAIVDEFLETVRQEQAHDTFVWYQYRLQRFVRKYPTLRASEILPLHVKQWVNGYTLSKTSRRNYMRAVKRCFAWADEMGYISRNPVKGLKVPIADRKEVFLTKEEYEQLQAHVRDASFRDLITVTWETGCRPQESLRVEARHIDLVNQRWVFPKSESKNKKVARIVYMTDTATEIVKRLIASNPRGELFRNRDGRTWSTWAVNCAFVRVRIRIGRQLMKQRKLIVSEEEIEAVARTLKRERTIKGRKVTKTPAKLREEAKRKVTNKLASSLVPKWSLYALRHSWATRALQNGVDPLTAAILMGHSDPSMLSKVYQHLALDPTHMRRQAVRAVKGYTEN